MKSNKRKYRSGLRVYDFGAIPLIFGDKVGEEMAKNLPELQEKLLSKIQPQEGVQQNAQSKKRTRKVRTTRTD